jgi:hypothetical protein
MVIFKLFKIDFLLDIFKKPFFITTLPRTIQSQQNININIKNVNKIIESDNSFKNISDNIKIIDFSSNSRNECFHKYFDNQENINPNVKISNFILPNFYENNSNTMSPLKPNITQSIYSVNNIETEKNIINNNICKQCKFNNNSTMVNQNIETNVEEENYDNYNSNNYIVQDEFLKTNRNQTNSQNINEKIRQNNIIEYPFIQTSYIKENKQDDVVNKI